jgi:adenylate cyclase
MFLAKKSKYLKKGKHNLFALLFFVFFLIPNLISQSATGIENYKYAGDSLLLLSKVETKNGNFEEANGSLKEALILFDQLGDNKAIGSCYKQMAIVNYHNGEFTKALINFENSISYFEQANYIEGVAFTTNNKGAIYYYLGNLPKALDHYRKALGYHEELGNDIAVAGTTQNIGNIYLQLDNFQDAILYFNFAKCIYVDYKDEVALSLVLSSLGNVYIEEKNYELAIDNLNTSLSLAIKHDEKQVQTEVFYNLGRLFEAKNDHLRALEYYTQSFRLSNEIGNIFRESSALIAYGALQLKLNIKQKAIKNCKLGLGLANKINAIAVQEEACKCLYRSYKSINLTSKALEYNEKMHLFKDSLNLKQTTDKILHMEFEKEMLLDSIVQVEKERKVQNIHNQIVRKKEKQRNAFIVAGLFVIVLAGGIYSRLNLVKKSKAILQIEKDRSEHLLLNILPFEIAEELKEKGFVNAQDIETATILFTDFKSFTETAAQLSPQELVEEINVYFKTFDRIIDQYNIEKIKTIGDAYMAAGGLQDLDRGSTKNTILAAIDMQAFVTSRKRENEVLGKPAFEMRVGIHDGPIVAGIVGLKKFQYDIWGDTVNTASRMESNSTIGKVNISQSTYQLVKDEEDLIFEYRGKISVKGKGHLEMYYVGVKEL